MTSATLPLAAGTAATAARTALARASMLCLGLAVLALVLAALYANHYVLLARGIHLPDVSPASTVLVWGFQVVAVLFVGWALLLQALAVPRVAAGALSLWASWTANGRQAELTALSLAVLGALLYAVLRMVSTVACPEATPEELIAGAARLPFQYRALTPWVGRGLHTLLPGLPLGVVFGSIEVFAALGVWVGARALLQPHVARPGARALAALAVFVPLAFNLATGYRYNALYFPWDTVSVAVFALGLALIRDRRWAPFYVIFVLGTFNRETTCFLTVAYVLSAWGRERPLRLVGHAAAQALLWIGVKALLAALYAGNLPLDGAATGLFSNQLERSARILFSVPGPVYLALSMGGLWVVVLLLRRWIGAPDVTRAFRFVPLFVLGMTVVGELMEVRIYSELIPLVALAALLAFRHLVGAVATEAGTASRTEGGTAVA